MASPILTLSYAIQEKSAAILATVIEVTGASPAGSKTASRKELSNVAGSAGRKVIKDIETAPTWS